MFSFFISHFSISPHLSLSFFYFKQQRKLIIRLSVHACSLMELWLQSQIDPEATMPKRSNFNKSEVDSITSGSRGGETQSWSPLAGGGVTGEPDTQLNWENSVAEINLSFSPTTSTGLTEPESMLMTLWWMTESISVRSLDGRASRRTPKQPLLGVKADIFQVWGNKLINFDTKTIFNDYICIQFSKQEQQNNSLWLSRIRLLSSIYLSNANLQDRNLRWMKRHEHADHANLCFCSTNAKQEFMSLNAIYYDPQPPLTARSILFSQLEKHLWPPPHSWNLTKMSTHPELGEN